MAYQLKNVLLSQMGSSEELLCDVVLAVDKVQNIITGGMMDVVVWGLLLPPLSKVS